MCRGGDPGELIGEGVPGSGFVDPRAPGMLEAAERVVLPIREEDPARLSSVSRQYRGDVETIVAKALEKIPWSGILYRAV
ncbi:MAG TPA: hypothetical protein VMH28_06860 [Candidatus Acidoferrales bacterium]|nr:hypothetical protein [Candidatus Acidoferrales bacterium]